MDEYQRQFRGVWFPKEIWLNKELTLQEKILLVEIDSLEDEIEGCWASNKHFVNNFKMTSTRVSQVIQSLQRKGYVNIDYDRNGKEIIKRHIRINRPPYPEKMGMLKNNIGMLKNEIGVCQKVKEGYVKKLKENNTLSNNTYLINNIIEYLNLKTEKNFKSNSKITQKHINARINEGYKLEDFKKVIDIKTKEWLKDKKMEQYLRPETLFGTKFESYLNQKEKEITTKDIAKVMNWSDF